MYWLVHTCVVHLYNLHSVQMDILHIIKYRCVSIKNDKKNAYKLYMNIIIKMNFKFGEFYFCKRLDNSKEIIE